MKKAMIETLCKKLPVSVLLRGLLERCFLPERVDQLFERHAQVQYTQQLLFSTLCDVLLKSCYVRSPPGMRPIKSKRRTWRFLRRRWFEHGKRFGGNPDGAWCRAARLVAGLPGAHFRWQLS